MEKINKENAKENLSEIEKIRLRNIAERKKKFKELGLDSLKKKAMTHIEYQKAQRAAQRLQCHKCVPHLKFPHKYLKRNHVISVHIGPRSSYPRVKDFVKKPTPLEPGKGTPFTPEYFREFPFISQVSDHLTASKKAYCNICRTAVLHHFTKIRNHMNTKTHKANANAKDTGAPLLAGLGNSNIFARKYARAGRKSMGQKDSHETMFSIDIQIGIIVIQIPINCFHQNSFNNLTKIYSEKL